jgi:hypothetical protein
MSIYNPITQSNLIVLPSAARTTTQTFLRQDLIDPVHSDGQRSGINQESGGLIAYLNVTSAPGGDTIQLSLDEQDPASGTWVNIIQTTAKSTAGMIKLKIKAAIADKTPTQSLAQIQDILPAAWRIQVIHSGSLSWTYSLGVMLYA